MKWGILRSIICDVSIFFRRLFGLALWPLYFHGQRSDARRRSIAKVIVRRADHCLHTWVRASQNTRPRFITQSSLNSIKTHLLIHLTILSGSSTRIPLSLCSYGRLLLGPLRTLKWQPGGLILLGSNFDHLRSHFLWGLLWSSCLVLVALLKSSGCRSICLLFCDFFLRWLNQRRIDGARLVWPHLALCVLPLAWFCLHKDFALRGGHHAIPLFNWRRPPRHGDQNIPLLLIDQFFNLLHGMTQILLISQREVLLIQALSQFGQTVFYV